MNRRSGLLSIIITLGRRTFLCALVFALSHTSGYAYEEAVGVGLAKSVSEITGVAISPLLGVSAVGAWRYYKAPSDQRSTLPWFCQPYAWGIGMALLLLCFIKDAAGTVTPALLKKPLDVVELFENKLSGLIACAAFVPYVVAQLQRPLGRESAAVFPEVLGLAATTGYEFSLLTAIIVIPSALAAFITVWLTSHAINVLILLSPFGLIDALLKLFKTSLLVTIVATYALNPYLGAAFSLLIIIVAALLAPWAFRLTLFGTLCTLDMIFPGRAGRKATPEQAHVFLARRHLGVPVRTFGRLTTTDQGDILFVYRPWFIRTARSVALPRESLTVGRGLLYPCLLVRYQTEAPQRKAVVFLPRYRSLEPSLMSHLNLNSEIQDIGALRGLKAIKEWLQESRRGGSSSLSVPQTSQHS